MCDGPGVCRPVICLPVLLCLWLKKFKSLFSSCCYSDEVLLAHCYSARVRERDRERQTQNGRLTVVSNGRELVVLERRGGGCWSFSGRFLRAWRHVDNRLSNEERYWTAPNIWPRFLGVKRGRERRKCVCEREVVVGGRGPCEKGVEGSWDLVLCWMKQPPTN